MLEPCLRTSPFRPGSGASDIAGETRRETAVRPERPGPAGGGLDFEGLRFRRPFAPEGVGGSPPPGTGRCPPRGLLPSRLACRPGPPASPRLAQLPCPLTPPALPPSQRSSGGWRPPREPPAGLAAAVQGSSPARRNSRHSGWPCGSAWRTRAGFEGPETAPATGALAGLPPLVTEAAPAHAAPQPLANQGAARSRIGQAGGKRSVRHKIPPRAAEGGGAWSWV